MLETVFLAASVALVVISVLASIGSIAFGLIAIAIDGFISRYGRRLETLPTEIALASIYLPIFSAVSATIAGAGINMATDLSRGKWDQLLGLVLVPLAFVTLFLLGLRASKTFLNADGSRRLRYTLRQIAEIARRPKAHSLEDLDTAIARVQRIRRVSVILIQDRASLRFFGWLRRRKGEPAYTLILNGCLIYGTVLTALGLHAAYLDVSIKNQRFGWIAEGVLAASFVLLNGGSFAEWRSYRRRCRNLGAELSLTTDRLQGKLNAARHAMLTDASRMGPSTARSVTSPSVLARIFRRVLCIFDSGRSGVTP